MNGIGLALLAGAFAVALIRVFSIEGPTAKDGIVTLRFAHWQLEGGIRGAFDESAREYEEMHPGVRVEQMAIPEQIAQNWSKTQLIGGTAPAIIQLGGPMGTGDEERARYFVPLTQWVTKPNPYNAGTDLAGVPWRETFVDNLESMETFSNVLLDYYGVPTTMFTTRVFYNRSLLREITGGDEVPTDYREFVELCELAADYELPGGGRLLPIAGSKYNSPRMMDDLFRSQTQKLSLELEPAGSPRPETTEVALAALRGQWDWQSPAVQDGLKLMQQIGRHMQPGFLSLDRDDALFYFVQGKALMIATGSWDATSIRIQSPFEVGAFAMPLPTQEDPEFGGNVVGPFSEVALESGVVFGVARQADQTELAIDFLRFITSQRSNSKFSAASGMLPGVVGVSPPPEVQPFMPRLGGFRAGFNPNLEQFGPDLVRVIETNLHRLVGPNGSVGDYSQTMDRVSPPAILTDLNRKLDNSRQSLAMQDTTLTAYRVLADRGTDPRAEQKYVELLEGQDAQERMVYRMEYELRASGVMPKRKEGD
ncbi:MAG: extracellular solute-binding protein [Chthoniobacterales bacterium]